MAKLPKINNVHGADTRNIINRAIDVLNQLGISTQDLVAKGQLTPFQYSQLIKYVNDSASKEELENIQTQLNNIAIDEGNESASYVEVRQARGLHPVLNSRMSAHENDISTIKNVVFDDVKGQLKSGYYNTAGNFFKDGTPYTQGVTTRNWYHYDVIVGNNRNFIFDFPTEVVAAMSLFNGDTFMGRENISNGKFFVPEGCTSFVINIPLTDPIPVTSNTKFESLDDANKVKIYVDGLSVDNNDSNQGIKILTIGNSFTVDSNEYLFDIAKSAGVKMVVGTAYDSGGGLESHWNKLQSDGTITAYNKWSPGIGFVGQPNALLKNIVIDEDWDIILYQQVSANSGDYTTFQPFLNNIHDYVLGVAINPDVRFGFNMTWAYSQETYGGQEYQFTSIMDAYQQAMLEMDFDVLVPTGTAIQNARTNPNLQAVSDDLTRDGRHLDLNVGRYIAALTYFESLTHGNVLSDVTYVPSGMSDSRYLAFLSKHAAKQSVINPFKVTGI